MRLDDEAAIDILLSDHVNVQLMDDERPAMLCCRRIATMEKLINIAGVQYVRQHSGSFCVRTCTTTAAALQYIKVLEKYCDLSGEGWNMLESFVCEWHQSYDILTVLDYILQQPYAKALVQHEQPCAITSSTRHIPVLQRLMATGWASKSQLEMALCEAASWKRTDAIKLLLEAKVMLPSTATENEKAVVADIVSDALQLAAVPERLQAAVVTAAVFMRSREADAE